MDKPNLAEPRAALLGAARTLLAENPHFTIKTLLDRAQVSRADFRRCFASRHALLASLEQAEVKTLSGLLQTAHAAVQATAGAQSIRKVAGSDVAAPGGDAWLERRLRVFERALAALEKRQEQAEQGIIQKLALLEEKFGVLGEAAAIARAVPQAAPEAAAAESSQAPAAEPAPAEAHVEEVAAPDHAAQPVSEEEMAAFIAQARAAAQKAAAQVPEPPPPRRGRFLAIGGAAFAILLILGAGILIASGALGHAAPIASGISHRRLAATGMPRVIALADSGDAAAQTVLALAYLRGQGVPGDDAAARRWSLAAAAQGQPVAQYLLGSIYLESSGEESEAVRWFKAAADQGNVKAMHNLAIAYAQGLGVARDPGAAAGWLLRAAALGYRDSEFDLGVFYERGLGVPQDARAALKWYLIAAARGDAQSALRAGVLKGQMDPGLVQAAQSQAAAFVPRPVGSGANLAPIL